MTTSPPKYLVISQQIESLIRSGRLTDERMPSVRGIAEAHNVSVVTASRALQVLRDKGLIQTVERSGCFLVAGPSRAVESWAVCLRVSPGTWQAASASVTRSGFEALARADGVTFLTDHFELRDGLGARDYRRQARAARSAGARGVFFMPSRLSDATRSQDEAFLSACREEGVAAVLIERNLRGHGRPLDWDLVATDDVGGGRACARHLLGLGRRRIACVVASPISTHDDRAAGYLHALWQAGEEAGALLPPLVLRLPPDVPDKGAYGWLADRLREHGADGVLCYHDYTAVGLILELLRRGVAVPRDLAVVGFDDLPIGSTFSVGVTTYAFPAVEVARQALRLMRERLGRPDGPPVKVVVPGRLVVRESTAAPAG